MRVALIQGGMGAEREVSLNTGKAFAQALDELKYDYKVFMAERELPRELIEWSPDVALLAVHGKYAEDGTLQGICEYLKIPYTGSGVLSSALCMDKWVSKQMFLQNSIPTPEYELLNSQDQDIEKYQRKMSLPVVVKPARDGSSVAVALVRTEDEFLPALKEAARYDHLILIERLIQGKEITIPILNDETLPSIEIVPKVDFYNYENKYTAGKTDYILPARLPEDILKTCEEFSLKAARVLQTRVYCRVDLMVDEKNQPYVLEVNTLPGCTPTSLVPKSAAHQGLSFSQFIDVLIKNACLDYEGLS